MLRWAVLDRGMDISESRGSMQLEKSRPRGTSSQVLSFPLSPDSNATLARADKECRCCR